MIETRHTLAVGARAMTKAARSWRAALGGLIWRNGFTLFGSSLTTVSAAAITVFFVMGLAGVPLSPYIGILTYLLLPAVFVFGLLIIPFGAYIERRRRRAQGTSEPAHIDLDFNSPRIRKLALIVGILTVINLMIISSVSFQGAAYMESNQFCGQACHTVMQPEFVAHRNSPHARIKCVDCHIGPGLDSLIHAKLNGLNQVRGVLTGNYQRPISTPVHGLADAELTCGECHNPEADLGDILRVTTEYSPDEDNTALKTAFLLHVGGRGVKGGGIHSWHLNPDRELFFYSPDERREEITYVKLLDEDGTKVEYFADETDVDPSTIPDSALRRMDCTDCHNRATHIFEMPGPALNDALDEGRIDSTLPSIKMAGLEALELVIEEEDGAAYIATRLKDFYKENHAEVLTERSEDLDEAIASIQSIYNRNIFPNMKIAWGTYPNHNGHTQFNGCFRCHDDGHSSRDGERIISQDCTVCHNVMAWQEEEPEILGVLGVQ
jgi:hypothetical protein